MCTELYSYLLGRTHRRTVALQLGSAPRLYGRRGVSRMSTPSSSSSLAAAASTLSTARGPSRGSPAGGAEEKAKVKKKQGQEEKPRGWKEEARGWAAPSTLRRARGPHGPQHCASAERAAAWQRERRLSKASRGLLRMLFRAGGVLLRGVSAVNCGRG